MSNRFRSDALLLFVALVWGSAFVPQRLAAPHLGPFLFNGLRFLLGAIVLFPWVPSIRQHSRQLFPWALIAGGLLVAASVCQQAGMEYTTAGKAGFLTGLYVVLVPVVLWAGWKKKMDWQSWAGALIAGGGVLLLGVDDKYQIQYGDGLELVGAVIWAVHLVVVGRAAANGNVLLFSVGQYLVAGVLNLAIGMVVEPQTLPGLADCWWAVAYVGIVSVALGYTLQAVGQKHAPAADAAIIFSMEAVFAAAFGYLFLGETLNGRQLWGCAMILGAVVVVQVKPRGGQGVDSNSESCHSAHLDA
jgi:drug/metabolite transporter (DMT)-like permease